MYSKVTSYKRNNLYSTYNLGNSLLNKTTSKPNIYKNSINSKSTLVKTATNLRHSSLEQLSFKGNVIDIKKGSNYSVKTLLHGNTQVSVGKYSSQLLLCKMFPNDDVSALFSEDQYTDMAKTNDLIGFLSSGKPVDEIINLIRIFLPDCKDVSLRLQSLGIEPDKYFEIKGQSEKLFLDSKSGWTYTQTEIENLNNGYNRINFAKLGFTKDSVFTIDGQNYHLDNSGCLTIPSDAICIPSRVTIKK